MDEIEATHPPGMRIITETEATAIFRVEEIPVAPSGMTCTMNSPNNTPEVGCEIFIKQEFTGFDSVLNGGSESTYLASQPVKMGDEGISCDGFNSEGPLQTKSSSPPNNFLTSVKIEDDYLDQPIHTILDIKNELPSESSDMEMTSEIGGYHRSAGDSNCGFNSAFAPFVTEKRSQLSSFCALQIEKDEEGDALVDPLHTSRNVENEMPLKSSENVNESQSEGSKHSLRSGNHLSHNVPILTTKCGDTLAAPIHLPQHSKTAAKPEIRNVVGNSNSNSQNKPRRKGFLEPRKLDEERTELLTCSDCPISLARINRLKRNMRTHTGERRFSCSHCSACFSQKCYLNSHLLTHTGEKPYSCSHCSASFTQKGSLKRHLRTHTGEKPFSCSHCSASFTQKVILKQHLLTHTGQKPFSCSHCSASFSRKGTLQQHLLTHTGEKQYSCSHCTASFTQKGSLKEHLQTHTGEKPFSCSHCSASFTLKGSLNRHLRTHTGEKPFSCSHCSASFTLQFTLDRHILTHTGEKPFSCSHCSASFARKNSLNAHILKHTGENSFKCSRCSADFAGRND